MSDHEELAPQADGRRLRVALTAIMAVALAVILLGAGWLVRGTDDPATAKDAPNAVDVGFARDMATHHTQAVTMAGVERDGTSDPKMRVFAFDIETGQQFQVGQMQGWLDAWGKTRNDDNQMAWMGHDHMAMSKDGLMPGMASQAELDRLVKAKGKALDVLFLQLMIRHHQGGIPMARYALEHANTDYVKTMAKGIVATQGVEIIEMERMLRALGGSTLPPPAQ